MISFVHVNEFDCPYVRYININQYSRSFVILCVLLCKSFCEQSVIIHMIYINFMLMEICDMLAKTGSGHRQLNDKRRELEYENINRKISIPLEGILKMT